MESDKEAFFKELRTQKRAYVDKLRNWFECWQVLPRVLFFGSGTLIILGSVSLPYLLNSKLTWKDDAAMAVSLSIALLTALNGFFAWQQSWQKRLKIATDINNLVAHWEIEMLNAARSPSPKTEDAAYKATTKLFEYVHLTIAKENAEFLSQIKPPQLQPPAAEGD